jgi:signal transduction histidine kinase
MIAASDRLERVIDQIVSLAEIQRGAVEARGTSIDVRALIDETVGDLRADDLHPISVSVAAGVPSVEGSERMLRAALRALVDNAVKFSPDGGPITIEAHARDGTLRVTVRDRGIGMSRAQLRVAFDAFRQGDGSETRAFGGLGIGLALADRIARAHGGSLVASSRRGHGSAFTIAIPLVPARDELHRAS